MLTTVACMLIPVGCAGSPPSQVVLHEDPAVAEVRYGVSPLIDEVGTVLEAASQPGGVSVGMVVALSDLDTAHLPGDVAESLGDYVSLFRSATVQLRQLQGVSEEMAHSLDAGDMATAGSTLDLWDVALADADGLLSEIEDMSRRFLSALRRERGLLSSAELEQLEGRLDAAILHYRELLDDYLVRVGAARELYEQSSYLDAPELLMDVEEGAVWIDQMIHVEGTLTHEESPLGGREVRLLRDDVVVGTAVTDDSGGYTGEISPPADFDGRCEVAARFGPGEQDAGRLRSVTTPAQVVTVRFHSSSVAWTYDSTCYPGIVTRVSGRVNSLGETAGRNVVVHLDGEPLCRTTTGRSGSFRCSMVVPPGSAVGEATLSVQVEGIGTARTAPAGRQATVSIQRATPTFDLPSDSVLILPRLFHGDSSSIGLRAGLSGISLQGEVNSPLPQGPAPVLVEWAGQTIETTVMGGTFESRLPRIGSALAVGPQVLSIRVVPDEPWHEAATAESRFFVVNLYVLGAGLLLIALVWFFVAAAAARRASTSGEALPVAVPVPVEPSSAKSSIERRTGSSWAHLVVEAYYSALRVVQRLVGLVQPPHMTMREYAAIVTQRGARVARAFSSLTVLAEKALYGTRRSAENEAADAWALAQDVSDSLQDDALEEPGEQEVGP